MSVRVRDLVERVGATVVAGVGAAMVAVGPHDVDTWKFWGAVGAAAGFSLVKGLAAWYKGNPQSASLDSKV